MTYGNGNDRFLTRTLRNKAREDEGQCTHCRPHYGENYRRGDGRAVWVGDDDKRTFFPSKSKARK